MEKLFQCALGAGEVIGKNVDIVSIACIVACADVPEGLITFRLGVPVTLFK